MQGLEKILEEIGELRGQAGSECTSEDHYIKKAWEHCLDRVVGIIRKNMNDGWIPVDERLPEVGEYVLGTTKYSEVLIFRYGWNSPHTKKMFLHMCGAAASGITAWMPLPDPYRTEDCCGEYKQDWKAGFMQRFERRI